jgi:hypothetical protein
VLKINLAPYDLQLIITVKNNTEVLHYNLIKKTEHSIIGFILVRNGYQGDFNFNLLLLTDMCGGRHSQQGISIGISTLQKKTVTNYNKYKLPAPHFI